MTDATKKAQELAQRAAHPSDWFEPLYREAAGKIESVPWARNATHPEVLEWLQQNEIQGAGRKALVVGCGLGDDAEALAARNFEVTAFDISPTAIQWSQQRFPSSPVNYQVADLFQAPREWQAAFDFILEVYTVQALPISVRTQTIEAVAGFVKAGGHILVVCHGRDESDRDPPGPPWPLARSELNSFNQCGLKEIRFETNHETGTETAVYHRILYQRE